MAHDNVMLNEDIEALMRRVPGADLKRLMDTGEGGEQDAQADSANHPELYRAAMKGRWKKAKVIFDQDPDAVKRKISNLGMTALHVAASCGRSEFVEQLVKILSREQLEAVDQLGRTALHHVALAADVDAAKAVVAKNPNLPYLGDVNRLTPLFYAAKWRHPSQSKKMVEYLCQVITEDENVPVLLEGRVCNAFTDDSAPDLIVAITATGSYDIALRILQRYPELAYKENHNKMSILHVLAMQPKAFASGNKISAWISWMYKLVQVDKEETKHKDSTSGVAIQVDEEETKHKDPTSGVANSKNRDSAVLFFKFMSKFNKGIWKMFKTMQRNLDAVRLVKFVCKELQKQEMEFVQNYFIPKDRTAILHLAVEHGVYELVQECLKHFPDLIWYAETATGGVSSRDGTGVQYTYTATGRLLLHDDQYTDTSTGHFTLDDGQYANIPTGRLLLHVAIEHRRVEIFNYLINLIGKNTKAYADLQLEGKNNSLHLAAKLAPTPQLQSVPGPAFQMQRELQWFKAVEALVYFELRTEKNSGGKTPRELFFDEHKDLLTNAKEWMKDMSNSCMVVATLVATVAFAAMITVPGGNNGNTGVPILGRKKLFLAFSISNAFSMIFSAISLLMFLSMQTSRYTEDDFLDLLPKVLLRGLISLGVAVGTMMISFGTAIGLSLQTRLNWAYIPITVAACFPVIIFTWLQLPLLLQALLFKSGPGIFQGQRDRKSWRLRKIGHRLLLANDRV
ncbi:uncharacterized protein [Coffea arabica]|uniref:PGG domain-containing protein n=1 Tax=Coffea arabica TaxID=13443 RepID=A0ABM4VYF6_COFAR